MAAPTLLLLRGAGAARRIGGGAAQVPAVTLSVKVDTKDATRRLNAVQRKQVPFATAVAITRTADAVVRAEKRGTHKHFDRPTPFTEKAFTRIPARKRDTPIRGRVFAKDKQAAYLELQIYGGIRRPKGRALLVPGKIELNRYGNIANKKIQKLLRKPNVFSGTVGGVPGIWQRYTGRRSRNRRPKLLVAYEPTTRYRPRFPFFRIAQTTTRRVFPRRFRVELARALRTAR